MKELLHKKIVKIELGSMEYGENILLVFTCDDGEKIAYEAFGDCCSTSWFSHIAGVKNLLGHEITKIIEREERPPTKPEDAEGDYEVLAIYGYVLTNWNGACYIEFRNDSNGYYGGSCEVVTLVPPDATFKEVTEDF